MVHYKHGLKKIQRFELCMVGLLQNILLVIIQHDVVVAAEFVTVATVASINAVAISIISVQSAVVVAVAARNFACFNHGASVVAAKSGHPV